MGLRGDGLPIRLDAFNPISARAIRRGKLSGTRSLRGKMCFVRDGEIGVVCVFLIFRNDSDVLWDFL